MSHPFSLSSFRIGSQDQIATITALGLRQVAWSPRKSVLSDAAIAAEPGPAKPTVTTPESRAEAEQRERSLADRAAQRLCERQFAEAARECRQATALVAAQPRQAGAQAQALSRALIDKMIGSHDLCIRVLAQTAGDKASVHAMNVAVISLLMGRVCGLDDTEMLDMGVGALMHDIGKLDLPEPARHLEDDFSVTQTRAYESHVAYGLGQARQMALAPGATLVIAQHHEHADGSGFPLRLPSERLSVASRIVSLVDRYDNLCNPHRAATAVTPHEALALLFAKDRAAFDGAILGTFIRMLGVYPPGSTVQLTDDRYGLVVGANSSRPLRPRVRVHDPRSGCDEPLLIELESTPGLGIRRSLKPGQLPRAALECLAPEPRVVYFFEPATRLARCPAECAE